MRELSEKYPEGCPTGHAVLTGGGGLKARHVIHAVGPVYRGVPEDAQRLAGAYRSSLELCSAHGITSIAFPSISTGVYGYPVHEAAPVAIQTVAAYLAAHPEIELVRFVLFDAATHAAYQRALGAIGGR